MKIVCKDCEEIETFDGSEDAKDNDWHKVGAAWICPDCWESDYADADADNSEDEDENELELDEEDETTNNTNNIIFFPGTRGNMHSSLKKVWDNKEDEVWEDY